VQRGLSAHLVGWIRRKAANQIAALVPRCPGAPLSWERFIAGHQFWSSSRNYYKIRLVRMVGMWPRRGPPAVRGAPQRPPSSRERACRRTAAPEPASRPTSSPLFRPSVRPSFRPSFFSSFRPSSARARPGAHQRLCARRRAGPPACPHPHPRPQGRPARTRTVTGWLRADDGEVELAASAHVLGCPRPRLPVHAEAVLRWSSSAVVGGRFLNISPLNFTLRFN